MLIDTNKPVTRARFAELVGLKDRRVGDLIAEGTLATGEPASVWLLAYIERLRAAASNNGNGDGDLDLSQERALLARAQRESIEVKTAKALGEYAPVEFLTATLASASAAVAAQLDQVPALLRRKCPGLPADVRAALVAHLTVARNEWVRATAALVTAELEALAEQEDADDEAAA